MELCAGRFESVGSGSNLYISGIDGRRELDEGPKSGWIYSVNCSFPSASAGIYVLRVGDSISFWYTLNSGDDVRTIVNGVSAPSTITGGSTVVPTNPAIDYSKVDSSVSQLSIGYDNQLPADPNVPARLLC